MLTNVILKPSIFCTLFNVVSDKRGMESACHFFGYRIKVQRMRCHNLYKIYMLQTSLSRCFSLLFSVTAEIRRFGAPFVVVGVVTSPVGSLVTDNIWKTIWQYWKKKSINVVQNAVFACFPIYFDLLFSFALFFVWF